jgi:hypothetical protein
MQAEGISHFPRQHTSWADVLMASLLHYGPGKHIMCSEARLSQAIESLPTGNTVH